MIPLTTMDVYPLEPYMHLLFAVPACLVIWGGLLYLALNIRVGVNWCCQGVKLRIHRS